MIEFIKGTIDYITPEYIVICNNDIGYMIYTPNPFIFHKEQHTTIYTYQHVREDILALYGFQNREERLLFTKLLNVTGIGPKGGLAILATGDASQVVRAIENEDEKFLTKFPGVGKKTARQMILDLKGKLTDIASVPEQLEAQEQHSPETMTEAVEALKVLGYKEKEIIKIIPSIEEGLTTEQVVKQALQKLLK
ncbi:Holliday junction branch migration protein RuvA [Bacillus carboniphilus]|uniref:Holliday junction branch migration complex subunit RuvA n=1 Tax=Bacillus carboniphilus TaxID=86663 RepID=A0ABY9JXG4_9BACI|nr:Holliday junction branch migration protein RuvA [Bacillus carboniphilus]WLR44066.1 Holliday junction branch migration protein RuvA [Bacillus carboniphilus]